MFELEDYINCIQPLEKDAQVDKTLYHYTDWNGLKGILKNRNLWLTDFRYLNDSSEIRYGYQEIEKKVYLHGKEVDFWSHCYKELGNQLFEKFDFFSTSFTRENYLYAWRCYANDGKGFAIGFKQEFFSPNNKPLSQNELQFGRGKVYYDHKDILPMVEKLILIAEKEFSLSKNYPSIEVEKIFGKYLAAKSFLIHSFKHGAYKEEEEFRIMCRKPINTNHPQIFFTNGSQNDSPHFASKKRVTYSFGEDAINEIWVGPQLHFAHAKNDIEKLLAENKYNKNLIEIKNSDIPYKPL